MATKLDKVDVVVVGVGWAGGIISAEMAKAERMSLHWNEATIETEAITSVKKTN